MSHQGPVLSQGDRFLMSHGDRFLDSFFTCQVVEKPE